MTYHLVLTIKTWMAFILLIYIPKLIQKAARLNGTTSCEGQKHDEDNLGCGRPSWPPVMGANRPYYHKIS
jgi:hypothetical protein